MTNIENTIIEYALTFPGVYLDYPFHDDIAAIRHELTAVLQEVISNLESIQGALLRMNGSIQAEGTFSILKWDKSYKRLLRRGEKQVIHELTMISCGFNLCKYQNKKQRKEIAA